MDVAKIHTRIAEVDKLKEANRISRQTLKDELENSDEYRAACDALTAAQRRKKEIKEQIMAGEEMDKLTHLIKENNEELSTIEEILTTELMEYVQVNNETQIPDIDGEPRKIKLIAKIMPKKKKWDDRDVEGKFAPAL